ncbi:MAG: PP2C family protein-serine/threonine phosphatase [Planctomycetota bacterium]
MNEPGPSGTRQPVTALTDWRERLREVTLMMKELSEQTEPQLMVSAYRNRTNNIYTIDGFVAISRRDLEEPWFRVTRSSSWTEEVNPWEQKDRLPKFDRGLMHDLIYGGEPVFMPDVRLDPNDPISEFLPGTRSLVAIPAYDEGIAKNMVVLARTDPEAFDANELPDMVWRTNLFGRATHTLVLKRELDKAYEQVDRELQTVAEIQRSLLPSELPDIDRLDIAAHYETSARAGGDYYDVFPLANGRWGFLIADVCGHGTPAAVLMAITHALAHTAPDECMSPGNLLSYVNNRLSKRYTDNGTFVTAFYGVFDPADLSFVYASAGHNPPRVKRCSDGSMFVLNQAQSLPLGIMEGVEFPEAKAELIPGDQVVLYTDGITEAFNDDDELYDVRRLDDVLANCGIDARALIASVLDSVEAFTNGRPADDDRTLVVLKVR